MFSKSMTHKTTLFQQPTQTDAENHDEQCPSHLTQLLDDALNTQENREAIISFPKHADKIAIGLCRLNEYQALTSENRLRICAHAERAHDMATAIIMLHRSGINTLANWLLVVAQPERATQIAASFEYLQRASLATQQNKLMVCAIHGDLSPTDATIFVNALSWIFFEGKLNQKNFDKLCASPQDAWLVQGGMTSSTPRL